MSEQPPVVVAQPQPIENNGRPAVTDQQYILWLEDMRPFLRQGHSLYYAMEKAGLLMHKDSIYRKYRDDEGFREIIDKIQATISELNNSAIFKIIENVHGRLMESTKAPISSEEAKMMALVAEKHRTSQPFFVSRVEEAKAGERDKDFGKIVDTPVINYVTPEAPKEGEDAKSNTDTAAGNELPADAQTAPGVAKANG